MADTFYGLSIGHGVDPSAVTVAASTTGLAIELRVVNGASISKSQLINALEVLEYRVATLDAPA